MDHLAMDVFGDVRDIGDAVKSTGLSILDHSRLAIAGAVTNFTLARSAQSAIDHAGTEHAATPTSTATFDELSSDRMSSSGSPTYLPALQHRDTQQRTTFSEGSLATRHKARMKAASAAPASPPAAGSTAGGTPGMQRAGARQPFTAPSTALESYSANADLAV